MTKLGKSAEFLRNEFISEEGNSLYYTATDKIAAKEYVKKFNIKTPNIISKKTDNCVVKANNDSSGVMIIINNCVVFGNESMLYRYKNKAFGNNKKDHWNYKNIKHQVFIEEYLEGHEIDYQFLCYKGRAGLLQIRNSKRYFPATSGGKDTTDVSKELIITRDGKFADNVSIYAKSKTDTSMPVPGTDILNKMWKLADTMSSDFLFTRVDLFLHNNEIYFGEYTFNPSAFKLDLSSDKLIWEHVIKPVTGENY